MTTFNDRITGIESSVAIKAPVAAATTAAITLSGLQTVDGVALAAGDRVLVRNQANAVENGIYDVAAAAWARSKDMDGARDVVAGTRVPVYSGTVNAKRSFMLQTDDPIIGTSDLTFELIDNSQSQNVSGDWTITGNWDFQAVQQFTDLLMGTADPSADQVYSPVLKVSGSNPGVVIDETDAAQAWAVTSIAGNMQLRDATAGSAVIEITPAGLVGLKKANPAVSMDLGAVTDAIALPMGTDAQRPVQSPGLMRYNTDSDAMEVSDGASWVTASSSRDLLQSFTLLNDTEMVFTAFQPTKYLWYQIEYDNLVPAVDATQLEMECSRDSGVVWDTGANDYGYAVSNPRAGSGIIEIAENFTTRIPLTGSVDSGRSGSTGWVRISNPEKSLPTQFDLKINYETAAGAYRARRGGGMHRYSEVTNGIRIFFNGGNIATGFARVYGGV